MALTVLALIGTAFVVDAAMHELVVDAKTAMQHAGLSQDYVARVIGMSESRLSLQLSGQELFTAFCRFGCLEMRETDFWPEFLEIRAKRFDRAVVTSDLGLLVAHVTELVRHARKPMLKAELPLTPKEQAS